jgi:MerR family transcriptional regulator, copper efflux regulator
MFTLTGMAGLQVSELAARAGVPPSTVRFYERAGLLPAARRAANGYRLFDESALDDLVLIARAKSAGMSLEDAADVVAAWHDGSCAALRGRLRAHLTAELGQASAQIADLAAFRRKLEAALDRLVASSADAGVAADDPGPDRCGAGCGCDVALPADAPGEAGGPLPGCSLDEGGLVSRLGQWRAVAAAAESAERDGDTVRLTLDPAMLPAVAALVAAEADCCPGARFTLEVTAGRAFLTGEIPGIGTELDARHP